jgi:hypothetical protein
VLLLLSVLLVVSATPAAMFIRDARSFHQEAYEKHNLGHIASAALERETALRNEARRLQPTQFNRASLADVVVPGDVWCRGFFGFGARALVPACPWTPGVEEPPEQSAKQENALETKIRTATSWFSAAMPFAGNVNALVYSDGWRMSRSDRSITWADLKVDEKVDTGAGSRLRVTAHLTMHPYEFMSGKEGLFDRTHSGDEPKSGDEPEPTFFGALVLGSLMLFVLTWRALAAITATFFGSRNLRRDVATPKSGAHGDWKQCRAEEKLLLRHLADHVIVNGLRNEHVIRNLWSKGLVWFDGSGFRIVDPALESEIRSADHSKAEVEFELANHGDTWSEFRLPFFTALGVAVIAIIVAAPNVLSSVMGVLAASAGGLVAVIQIMNALTRKKS